MRRLKEEIRYFTSLVILEIIVRMLKWFEPWNPIYLCVYFDLSFGFNTTFWTLTVSALAIIKLIKCFQAYNNTIQVSLKNLYDVLAVFVFYDSRGPSDLIYRHPSKVAQTPNVSQFFCVLPHLIFKLFFHLFSDENNWKKCWNSSQRIILWYPFLMKYILWYTFRVNVLKVPVWAFSKYEREYDFDVILG